MHELNVLLKIEFKRLFKNKLFYISLFIGDRFKFCVNVKN